MDRLDTSPASHHDPVPSMDEERAAARTIPVYLIEDSPVIRENLIATLEEMAPVTVVGSADSESAATDWLARHDGADACRLVIVDIFLKGGSGLGVLHSMTQSRGERKVAVLSNYATPEMRQRCIELGADRVFDKSDEIDALVEFCIEVAQAA